MVANQARHSRVDATGAHVNFAVAAFIVQREAANRRAELSCQTECELFSGSTMITFSFIYRIAGLSKSMRRADLSPVMPPQTVHRGARLPQILPKK